MVKKLGMALISLILMANFLQAGKVVELSLADFDDEVVKSDVPVLVDVYATWCGPCRQMSPVVDAVAKEVGTSAKVFKVDSDKERQLTRKLKVNALPTFVVYKNGKEVKRVVGVVSKQELLRALK